MGKMTDRFDAFETAAEAVTKAQAAFEKAQTDAAAREKDLASAVQRAETLQAELGHLISGILPKATSGRVRTSG